jgi:hypothetical protein
MEKHLREYLAFTQYLPWVKSSGITRDPSSALTQKPGQPPQEGPFETIFAMELAQKLAEQDNSAMIGGLRRAMGRHGYAGQTQQSLKEGINDVHALQHPRNL